MLKVILTIGAIISSIIALTVFSTSLPATQKQVEENAAAIQSNAEYIQDVEDFAYTVDGITDGLNTRLEAVEEDVDNLQEDYQYTFLPKQLSDITGSGTTESPYILNDNYTRQRVLKCLPIAVKGGGGNDDWMIFYAERKNTAYGGTKITYFYISGGSTPARITYQSYTIDFTTWHVSKLSIYSTGTVG